MSENHQTRKRKSGHCTGWLIENFDETFESWMKPLIEYTWIKYSQPHSESPQSLFLCKKKKTQYIQWVNKFISQMLRKNLIAFLTKNCNKFNSDVKLQLEQEMSAPFFAAIYYYFNSILLLVATSAV